MKFTAFEREERHKRRALVVRIVNDLVKQGISVSRISLRSTVSRSSIYQACRYERYPSEKSLQLLQDYYRKVLNKNNCAHLVD